jgi:hypothetical protein
MSDLQPIVEIRGLTKQFKKKQPWTRWTWISFRAGSSVSWGLTAAAKARLSVT